MEESYRKERPASSSSESCANELTRLNSGELSSSVADFKDTLLQSENVTKVLHIYFICDSSWLNLVYRLVLFCDLVSIRLFLCLFS